VRFAGASSRECVVGTKKEQRGVAGLAIRKDALDLRHTDTLRYAGSKSAIVGRTLTRRRAARPAARRVWRMKRTDPA
jgi:hypothetical protein